MRIRKERSKERNAEEKAIAKAVWEGRIDGWTTRMVADEFGIATSKALRILKKICDGQCSLFPFERGAYEAELGGVGISDGRTFVWGEDSDYSEGHGKRHHNWFYT
jgi:hypothetical protein